MTWLAIEAPFPANLHKGGTSLQNIYVKAVRDLLGGHLECIDELANGVLSEWVKNLVESIFAKRGSIAGCIYSEHRNRYQRHRHGNC